ncbi:MAG TPA: cytochrome c oxidase subunit 3 family protein [Anaeromyxobacteraceae bacterium]|jgi:cytochrome c oxidase subunit 3
MSTSSEHVAHHFPDLETQAHAARLGMWLFLATEILLFAGLFTAYALYRMLFPSAFAGASGLIDTRMGALNTVVLITSSLTVALAYHFSRQGRGRAAAALLLATIALAGVFLVVKYVEYAHHIGAGHLPGRYYRYPALDVPGAAMFFTLYFLMTGLHGIHVVAGMGVLAWLAAGAWRGSYGGEYSTPLELGGMYWHLVDLVWIFLFPLLYLI